MFRRSYRPLWRDPRTRNALSEGRPGLGRAHRLRPGSGEELAARLLRHAGAQRRPRCRPRLAIRARHGHALGRAGRQARPGPGRGAGRRGLSADRPADRLASRAVHRGGAEHSGRSRGAASGLARGLQLRHRQGRARAERLRAHQRSLLEDRQSPGRGRGVERDPRLRRQLPRRMGRTSLRRRCAWPPPNAGAPSSPSSCRRRPTPIG